MLDLSYFGTVNGSCENYSVLDFNTKFTPRPVNSLNHNKILILNFNIRSFNSNVDEFSVFLDELIFKPHIIVLSETWFSNTNKGDISGYTGFHSCRISRGGGISVYISNSLHTKNVLCSIDSSPEVETVHINVTFNETEKNTSLDIIGVYRPPEPSHIDSFIDKLDLLLNSLDANKNIILAGDLNVCVLRQDSASNKLLDLMRSYSLIPHMIIPTRPNPLGNDTLIDQIWTNFSSDLEAGVFNDTKITDHCINFAFLPVETKTKAIKIKFRDHSEMCINELIDKLTNFSLFFPLLTANKNYNEKFDLFVDEIERIYKKCCPIKTKTLSETKIKKPWINHKIVLMIKRKHYLFQRYKNGALSYYEFQQYQKSLSKIIKKAKISYYKNKYNSCKGDSSKTWKITNNILGHGKHEKTKSFSILHNSTMVTNDSEISDIFNDYFINVSNNLSMGIAVSNTNPLSYMGEQRVNSFIFAESTTTEVSKVIKGFKNKKSTLNNIPILILKKISHIISPVLSELFNESIKYGIFPNRLKIGRVIPIHKSGSQKEVGNFRPITTLSLFSKIFEKLVHKRLSKFIAKYKLINENQFGFQKNKNTSDTILEFLDNFYDSINNDQHLLAIYLDFSKAFDTVNHDILMKKLFHMGFRGAIHSWLYTYLSNRKQYVAINDSTSKIYETNIGVPQGSTLGPLLFILYINDMSNSLAHSKILHFADDSTMYVNFDKNKDISLDINNELESIHNWLRCNKLYLNVSKTKYMIINNRDRPPDLNLKIGNSNIERCSEHKFLGVYIDDRLTFSTHISKISSKISRGIGVIRKMKQIVSREVLRQLYFSFIYSNFTYAITTYGSASRNQLKRLNNLINKSIKIVSNVDRLTPEICKREKIFDFQMSFRYFCSIKMYQVTYLGQHNYFINKMASLRINHNYETRSSTSEIYSIPHYNYAKCQNSFPFIGTKFWNELPTTIRNSENLAKFKQNLKNHI